MNRDEVQAAQAIPTDFSGFDAQAFTDAQVQANPRFAGDSKLHVSFYSKPQINLHKSEQAQRAVFDDAVMVRIFVPGDKLNVIDREASHEDKLRFARQYDAFQKGKEQTAGTPLIASGFISESQVAELNYFKIFTVEQLAGANDDVASRFLGLHDLKAKAVKFLERANGTDALQAKFDEKLAERDKELAELRSMVEKLTAPDAAAKKDAAGKKQ